MFIVIEGISAVGKTTAAAKYAPAIIHEATGNPPESDGASAIGHYWSDKQSERWQQGLALAQTNNIVCFDTDPLKIHYPWCLWQIGEGSREAWIATVEATRERMVEKRLGFADRVIFLERPEAIVRQQKLNDQTRRRGNFEINVRLCEPLRHWYVMLDALSPGHVVFNAIPASKAVPMSARTDRYDLQLFDALIEVADRKLDNSTFNRTR